MSTRILILERLSKIIGEGVDLNSVKSLPLYIDKRVTFNHNGMEFGMVLQKINSENLNIFPKVFSLNSNSNLEGYYNFGFDVNNLTSRPLRQTYKELAVPLAIIVKSFIEWIDKNNPYLVTIFADAGDTKEKNKKISLYSAVLNRENSKLNSMGYYWDFFNSPSYGQSIYLKKLNK